MFSLVRIVHKITDIFLKQSPTPPPSCVIYAVLRPEQTQTRKSRLGFSARCNLLYTYTRAEAVVSRSIEQGSRESAEGLAGVHSMDEFSFLSVSLT